ncbi:efflux RND transporter permease subunit [Mesonia mobilis]|uniref:efflux RND transporter permease subunit n=1 Tax=Mesonia mobilis TaxID=369791 RepID=UPI0026EB9F02|nr:efflux RND transporter permease subunit [Mesonia mobilis]
MKKIISYFIKYSVAVNVVILAFIIFGVIGIFRMKSSFFPLIDSQIITISVAYPGAAPQEIEEGVILKIEDNLKGLVGIERVTSVSRENGGSVTIEIEQGELAQVEFFDVMGKKVLQASLDELSSGQVNVSNLSSGIYLARINNKISKKVIIE